MPKAKIDRINEPQTLESQFEESKFGGFITGGSEAVENAAESASEGWGKKIFKVIFDLIFVVFTLTILMIVLSIVVNYSIGVANAAFENMSIQDIGFKFFFIGAVTGGVAGGIVGLYPRLHAKLRNSLLNGFEKLDRRKKVNGNG